MLRLVLLSLVLAVVPAAAAESYADREAVRSFIAEMRERHGFAPEQLTEWFGQARTLPAVLKAIQPPAVPGLRSWRAYRARFVDDRRISGGVRFWREHADALAEARKRYGVAEEIVVAIIGIETIYGRRSGNVETFSALATLAFDYPPRAELFRHELEELLLLAREEQRSPLAYRGSYAGAIGLPQFLPSSVRRYAVDFDGSGHVDLLDSPVDAIGSIAHFLNEHGWQAEGPLSALARVDATRCQGLLAAGIQPRETPSEMAANGVSAAGAPERPAALIDLPTPNEPTEYRLGYKNFYVLTRYNRSSFYAAAVSDLAQALVEARPAR